MIGGYFALRSVTIQEAERDTRERVQVEGRLVETALTDGVLRGDAARAAAARRPRPGPDPRRVGRAREAVAPDGTILYSDEPRLIGRALRAGRRRGGAVRDRRRRRGAERPGRAREPLRAPGGQAAGGAHADPHARRHAGAVRDLPALQRGQRERLADPAHARAAAAGRAGRPAADPAPARLRPGAAAAARSRRARAAAGAGDRGLRAASAGGSPPTCTTASSRTSRASPSGSRRSRPRPHGDEDAQVLNGSVERLRQGVRDLRTLLVEIHPPRLESAGLEAALDDLLSPLRAAGLQTTLEVEPGGARPRSSTGSRARRCATSSSTRTRRTCTVVVTPSALIVDRRRPRLRRRRGASSAARQGHVGLSLLEDLAAEAGATLACARQPGAGTTVEMRFERDPRPAGRRPRRDP